MPQEARARRSAPPDTTAVEAVVPLSDLPVQAQVVHQRILTGGPFRHTQDGTVFGNRERHLPRQPRGFYREYTVPTPGVRPPGGGGGAFGGGGRGENDK